MSKRRSAYRGIPDNPASHDSREFSFLEAMKEVLESIVGHRPNVPKKDRMVTHGELENLRYKPRGVAQADKPTPDEGEVLLWKDTGAGSGDPTHYIVWRFRGEVITFASEETVS